MWESGIRSGLVLAGSLWLTLAGCKTGEFEVKPEPATEIAANAAPTVPAPPAASPAPAPTYAGEAQDRAARPREGTPDEQLDQPFSIDVLASGDLMANDTKVSLEELDRQLAAAAAAGQRSVKIRAHRDCSYAMILQVVRLCKQHGIDQIFLSTSATEP